MKTKTTIAILALAAVLAAGCGETQSAAPADNSPAAQTDAPASEDIQSDTAPPPTSAPAEVTKVEDGVFKFGQAATTGTLDITVSRPIGGYDTLFEQSYQAVRVKACASGANESVNPYDFKAMYPGSELADAGIGTKDPALHDTQLRVGECVAGWVTFDGKRPLQGIRYEGYTADFDPVVASWEKGA